MQEMEIKGLKTLFVPGKTEKAIVLFHGYGANYQDLFPLHDYLDPQQNFHWFFPNGPERIPFSGMYEGRAWFPIDVAALEESMRTGKPREFSQLSSLEFNQVVEKMDEFLLELKNQYKKIIVGGFSQGAMCSSHVKTRDALILLSGVLFDEKKLSVDPLFSNLPVFQSHGKFDDLLAYQEGKKLNHWLLQNKAQVQFVEFGGGHEIPPMVLSELKKFIASID